MAHGTAYLSAYEGALWRLLVAVLCPVQQGYRCEIREGALLARNDRMEVALDLVFDDDPKDTTWARVHGPKLSGAGVEVVVQRDPARIGV